MNPSCVYHGCKEGRMKEIDHEKQTVDINIICGKLHDGFDINCKEWCNRLHSFR